MTAIIINFEIAHKLRNSTNAKIEDKAWHLNFEKDQLELDILEASTTHERLDAEEKLYEFTRDPYYSQMLKELDRRNMSQQYNELCHRTV